MAEIKGSAARADFFRVRLHARANKIIHKNTGFPYMFAASDSALLYNKNGQGVTLDLYFVFIA